jgi:hypothetical protein
VTVFAKTQSPSIDKPGVATGTVDRLYMHGPCSVTRLVLNALQRQEEKL